MTDTEREHVLRMVEDGKITAEEGLRLMQALEADLPEDAAAEAPGVIEAPAASGPPFSGDEAARHEFQSRINTLRRLWLIPLGLGIAFAIPGAWWMYLNVQAGLNGWFVFPFLFFLLGVGLVALGAGSRTSRWLYLDVREPRGAGFRRIRLAFPIPSGLIRWGMQTFGHRMPDRQRARTDDVLRAVFESDSLDEPMLVDVKEDDGQHVRVYIG